MTEAWTDVVGYEGLYQISNLGRVKAVPKKRIKKDLIMKNIARKRARGLALQNCRTAP